MGPATDLPFHVSLSVPQDMRGTSLKIEQDAMNLANDNKKDWRIRNRVHAYSKNMNPMI